MSQTLFIRLIIVGKNVSIPSYDTLIFKKVFDAVA